MSTVLTSKKPKLSDDQIKFYNTEGYLIYKQPVLENQAFSGLKNHFEEKLQRLPEGYRPEAMDVPHFTDTKLFQWLFHDDVLDLVEPILGPDIALFSSHFICKPKGNGKRVPWHEDSFYWKGMMEPMQVCTVWLAIDPSTTQNGCMNVIPRTLRGYSEYEPVDATANVFATEIKAYQRDDSKKVAIQLDPNQASLHDGRLMHGSDPNTSSIRRCGYTMRYISTRTKFNDKDFGAYHHCYIARGKPHADNNWGDPTKEYPEKARYREVHKKGGH